MGTNYQKVKPDSKADIKSLKNRFENVSPQEEARKKAEEIRQARLNKEKLEREQEEKRRAQEQSEVSERPKTNQSSNNNTDIGKLNTVSSSPFKAGSSISTESNDTSSNNKTQQTVGKLKINSQFLQGSNTAQSKADANDYFPKNEENNVSNIIV